MQKTTPMTGPLPMPMWGRGGGTRVLGHAIRSVRCATGNQVLTYSLVGDSGTRDPQCPVGHWQSSTSVLVDGGACTVPGSGMRDPQLRAGYWQSSTDVLIEVGARVLGRVVSSTGITVRQDAGVPTRDPGNRNGGAVPASFSRTQRRGSGGGLGKCR